jgi:uncharacterized protein YabE (DUF348 family)
MAGIPADRGPEQYTASFLDTNLSAMLQRLQVTTYPEDKVFAFPDPSLGLGSTIMIFRAQAVVINDAGSKKTVRTWSKTVAELAEEQRLDLGEKDKVVPARDAILPLQATPDLVTITRVAETEQVKSTPIEFKTQTKDDPSMDRGTTVTEQAGKLGTLKTTYLVRRENGKEVSRKVMKTERTLEPVTQIVRRGTKVVVYGTGIATYCPTTGGGGCTNSMGAASNVLPRGTKVTVVNPANGKSVTLTINDSGIKGRAIIDLSFDAFAALGGTKAQGIMTVRVEKP